ASPGARFGPVRRDVAARAIRSGTSQSVDRVEGGGSRRCVNADREAVPEEGSRIRAWVGSGVRETTDGTVVGRVQVSVRQGRCVYRAWVVFRRAAEAPGISQENPDSGCPD